MVLLIAILAWTHVAAATDRAAMPLEDPPQPSSSKGRELIVRETSSGSEVWVVDDREMVQLDPVSGRVLRAEAPVPLAERFRSTLRDHGWKPGWQNQLWTTAGVDGATDLLASLSKGLFRIRADGARLTVPGTGHSNVTSAAGLADGSTAFVDGRGVTIADASGGTCTLPGARGTLVAPRRSEDPLLLVAPWVGVLTIDLACRPIAFLASMVGAAALSSDALWVLERDQQDGELLSRYPRPGDRASVTSVRVTGRSSAALCGEAPCFAVGDVRWDPFTGQTDTVPSVPAEVQPARLNPHLSLVGTVFDTSVNPYALRRVPEGLQVVNTLTGRDVGARISRWAEGGVVSADGRLALLVDRDGPITHGRSDRTALFEVATGREVWSLPVAVRADTLTASAISLHKLAGTDMRMPVEQGWYLVDTMTGRRGYLFTRFARHLGIQWLRAGLSEAIGWWGADPATPGEPTFQLGDGRVLQPWPGLVAPLPSEGAPADDPVHRALAAASGAQDGGRIRELQIALGTDAENPLDAFSPSGPWPEQAGLGDAPRSTAPLTAGRLLPKLVDFRAERDLVQLPLQAGRPTLVVMGPSAAIGLHLQRLALDPFVDLLWATEAETPRWPWDRFEEGEPDGIEKRALIAADPRG